MDSLSKVYELTNTKTPEELAAWIEAAIQSIKQPPVSVVVMASPIHGLQIGVVSPGSDQNAFKDGDVANILFAGYNAVRDQATARSIQEKLESPQVPPAPVEHSRNGRRKDAKS